MNINQLNKRKIRRHLQQAEIQDLFISELGWDYGGNDIEIPIANHRYILKAVVQKKGLVVYQHVVDSINDIPDSTTRRKIENAVAKHTHEHIIVFISRQSGEQCWQWARRESGRSIQHFPRWYRPGQSSALLIEKLEQLRFVLDEEGELTISEVAKRVRTAFYVESVTKKFYDHFKNEHGAFLSFINGINSVSDREWYASLMLNRMMFIYFIQKRGFLDGDKNYLRNRLIQMKKKFGGGHFQSFYRLFLLRLFHEGLGQPESHRKPDLDDLLGEVPYINGGLFDPHDLEENYNITIPDEAFQQIFAFFDAYDWHLDDRPLQNDKEINPDVIGYIFEKYINQKQMGAYYTKEDITGYIARNSIIPKIFDHVSRLSYGAFKSDSDVWKILEDNPDRYIQDTVCHGITYDYQEKSILAEPLPLPPEIAAGLEDPTKRNGWGKPADKELGLPTENWHEVIARRQRYKYLYTKISAGKFKSIDSFITQNLKIEQFVLDVITENESPKLTQAFWEAISNITILDPTCGSGAFLFAALNILEPIYAACLDSMRGLNCRLHESIGPNNFKEELSRVDFHANEKYFILKSIIVNNLYGVDIMDEAVEICKLRLFLKLVAQLDESVQIEPLPDIDFNIRSGNTLVGFASENEAVATFESDVEMKAIVPEITKRAQITGEEFHKFQEMQTDTDVEVSAIRNQKSSLKIQLDSLRNELNRYLAKSRGIGEQEYDLWNLKHKPFHWFIEFYAIMCSGGFSTIIGNPPYIQRTKVKYQYALTDFITSKCPDIYAVVLERSLQILGEKGRIGMIVPLSLGFSTKFESIRNLVFTECDRNWFSSFDKDPRSLFVGVIFRHTIHLAAKGSSESLMAFATHFQRWYPEAREHLFSNLTYSPFCPELFHEFVPKVGSNLLSTELSRLIRHRINVPNTAIVSGVKTKYPLHYKNTAYNYLTFCRKKPPCTDIFGQSVPHRGFGTMYFRDQVSRDIAFLFLNGKIMFTWWTIIGDGFHVTLRTCRNAPIDLSRIASLHSDELLESASQLEAAMNSNTIFHWNAGKHVGNHDLSRCRHITDKSDQKFLKIMGVYSLWDEIELFCSQTIKLRTQEG